MDPDSGSTGTQAYPDLRIPFGVLKLRSYCLSQSIENSASLYSSQPIRKHHGSVGQAATIVAQMLRLGCAAFAKRMVLPMRRFGLEPNFVISCGIAKNEGVVKRIEDRSAS